MWCAVKHLGFHGTIIWVSWHWHVKPVVLTMVPLSGWMKDMMQGWSVKRGKILQDKAFATQLKFSHVLLGQGKWNGMNSGPLLVQLLVGGTYTAVDPFIPSYSISLDHQPPYRLWWHQFHPLAETFFICGFGSPVPPKTSFYFSVYSLNASHQWLPLFFLFPLKQKPHSTLLILSAFQPHTLMRL